MNVACKTMSRFPTTWMFVGSVALATEILAALSKHEQRRLMLLTSTNLHGLAERPLLVLLGSVLWSTPSGLLTSLAPAAVVMSVVEWRIGSLRTLLVLAAGHIGATLLAASGIASGVQMGLLPGAAAHAIDVGVSYAIMAVLGFAVGLTVGRARLLVAGGMLGLLLTGVALDRDFTSFGHLFAALIGLSLAVGGLGDPRESKPRLAATILITLTLAAPLAGYVEIFSAGGTTHLGQGKAGVRKLASQTAVATKNKTRTAARSHVSNPRGRDGPVGSPS